MFLIWVYFGREEKHLISDIQDWFRVYGCYSGRENLPSHNPLYSAVMLEESICHFRCVGSILLLLFYFDGKYCKQTM